MNVSVRQTGLGVICNAGVHERMPAITYWSNTGGENVLRGIP